MSRVPSRYLFLKLAPFIASEVVKIQKQAPHVRLFLVSKQADDGPDISLRDGLTRAGWPLPAAQTIAQTTLEYFVVDWDFEYPPEQVSLFDFTGDCPTPVASALKRKQHASFDHAGTLQSHRRRRHRSRSFGVGRSGAQHVRRAAASAAASSSSFAAVADAVSAAKAKIPVRFFVTDPRGYASIVAEIARPFNDAQHMMLSSPVLFSISFSSLLKYSFYI